MTSHLGNEVESIGGFQQYKYKVVFLSRSSVIEKTGCVWGESVNMKSSLVSEGEAVWIVS